MSDQVPSTPAAQSGNPMTDVVNFFASRMDGPELPDTPAPAKAESTQPGDVSTAEGDTDETAATADDSTPDDGPEQDKPESETQEADADQNDDPEIEVDGELVKLSDLKGGYMRQADYTRKTQAVAEQRKALEATQEQYAHTLAYFDGQAKQALEPFEKIDWQRLQTENPAQYQAAQQQYAKVKGAVDQMKAQQEAFLQQVAEHRKAEVQKQAAESSRTLKSLIPDWSNAVYSELGKFAADVLAIPAEEFNAIADWRPVYTIKLARDAYMAQQAAKTLTPQARDVKDKTPAKAAGKPVDRAAQAKRQAAARLAKTGTREAAADWFLSRM